MPQNPYFDRSIEFENRDGGIRAVASPDELRIQLTGAHAAKLILRPNDVEPLVGLLLAWSAAADEYQGQGV